MTSKISYLGFEVLATTQIPISEESLVYGWNEHGLNFLIFF